MFSAVLSLAVVLATTLPPAAQPTEIQPTKLHVQAAAAPMPALMFRLLPEMEDLERGNAVVCYMRALSPDFSGGKAASRAIYEVDTLMEMSFAEFKKANKARVELPELALREIERGARREFCDWETLGEIRKDGLRMLIPHAQNMRQFARLLSFRARLEIAEGKFGKAVDSLQTILAASRHVAEKQTLIQDLVGLAMVNMALDGVEDMVQQPGSPNLYWALTTLPQPFLQVGKSIELEKIIWDVEMPELKKLEKEPFAPAELARMAAIASGDFEMIFNKKQHKPDFAKQLQVVGKVVQHYPAARKALLDQGRKVEEVDAFPMLQVVLIRNFQQYRRLEDERLKWTYVPYWQAHDRLRQLDREIKEFCDQESLSPFHSLMPALARVHWAHVRTDRRIAALRSIEAIRLYAAEKGGPPKTLDEISLVPVPLDPATGKRFQYASDGSSFKLYGPPPEGMPRNEANVVNYHITLEQAR